MFYDTQYCRSALQKKKLRPRHIGTWPVSERGKTHTQFLLQNWFFCIVCSHQLSLSLLHCSLLLEGMPRAPESLTPWVKVRSVCEHIHRDVEFSRRVIVILCPTVSGLWVSQGDDICGQAALRSPGSLLATLALVPQALEALVTTSL